MMRPKLTQPWLKQPYTPASPANWEPLLPPELIARMDAIAARQKRSRTNMIEIALEEWARSQEAA
ncbi:MAG TPA: ribbon-helix-helix protein, CopG family [Acetobacteraceae bacterium]|nr:ribbon-helix-helix protein, CopG family [Acetobacteraceae bacterium]